MRANALAILLGLAISVPASAQTVLRMAPHAALPNLDPVVSQTTITLNHSYMVYDTLFAMDGDGKVQPQMVGSWKTSDDGLVWDFTLRPDLKFHDGSPVTANDVIASIKRWAPRSASGRAMMARAEGFEAVDERSFRLKLKRPFGPVTQSFAELIAPFVMREKDLQVEAGKAITTANGSGPFVFQRNEWDPGGKVVYTRNTAYVPRKEPPTGLAGSKEAKVDRVEWTFIPDAAAAAGALTRGEIDIFEQVPHDFLKQLAAAGNIKTIVINKAGAQAMLRPNSKIPPFDNPKARQALMYMIDRAAYMDAVVGNPDYSLPCLAPFGCGTPSESLVATEPFARQNLEKARQLMIESGYKGEPVVLMDPVDRAYVHSMAIMTASLLKQIGVNVDLQATDWGTMQARISIKDPPAVNKGAWNLMATNWTALIQQNPIANATLSTACDGSNWQGWPCDEELEKIRLSYLDARNDAERKQVMDTLQRRFFEVVPYVHLGQYFQPLAYRSNVEGLRPAMSLSLWGVEKK
jgi:peptide/nickel transport system substrate-binding protein